MIKVPYIFSAIPKFLLNLPWLGMEKYHKFLLWAFNQCSAACRYIVEFGRKILLDPFEFVASRYKHASECFLSENVFRTTIKFFIKIGLLKKSPKSIPSKLAIYQWCVDRFDDFNPIKAFTKKAPKTDFPTSENEITQSEPGSLSDPQHNEKSFSIDQENENNPVINPQISTPIYIYKRSKESLQTGPTDFSSKKIEVIPGVTMTQEDYEKCLKIKNGSKEAVEKALHYIVPRKKYEIKDWPNALRKWDVKDTPSKASEHEEIAKNVVSKWENDPFCVVEFYRDRNKDQKGLLFYTKGGVQSNAVFVSFSDSQFKQKVKTVIQKWENTESLGENLYRRWKELDSEG